MANLGYIQLVRRCNQYCRFCSNPTTGEKLDLDTALRQVDDFAERGYHGVILTGGEPSLSPLVADVSRRANERGLHVRMITNGSRLADIRLAGEYVDAGCTHFHVSLHSHREAIHDYLSGVAGSFSLALQALDNLDQVGGATVDLNIVINALNADHLDSAARAFSLSFPFVRHFVFNNLDPSMGRAQTNRDTAHRLADFELTLARAMRYLHAEERSFRVERVPLCYMTEFAHCSTETRKIVKGEERIVHFLDDKGTVRQTDFVHAKDGVCASCPLDEICGGLFDLGDHYDLDELHPVFVSKEEILRRIREGA